MEQSDWTEGELVIFSLFDFRCAVCKIAKAVTLHEICPKSKCPKNWRNPENRLPVCNSCHFRIHREGITKQSRQILTDLRLSVENANNQTS